MRVRGLPGFIVLSGVAHVALFTALAMQPDPRGGADGRDTRIEIEIVQPVAGPPLEPPLPASEVAEPEPAALVRAESAPAAVAPPAASALQPATRPATTPAVPALAMARLRAIAGVDPEEQNRPSEPDGSVPAPAQAPPLPRPGPSELSMRDAMDQAELMDPEWVPPAERVAAAILDRMPLGPAPETRSPLELPKRRKPAARRSELVPDGNGRYRAVDSQETFVAEVSRDGRVRITDTPGLLSVNDRIMRAAGQDPYLARKRKFLERTREERADMARQERAESLRDSVAFLSKKLSRIWQNTRQTPAQRRRLLFMLWDECAESGSESGSESIGRAGESARATIIAFIRRTVPKGSEHAYSAEEIAALNRTRASRQTFSPY